MKSKKLQIAVLSVLLAAVIAAGVWFLSGGSQNDGAPQDDAGVPDAAEGTGFDWLGAEDVRHRLLDLTEEDCGDEIFSGYGNFLSCQGQLCQFVSSGDTLQVVSVHDGSVLQSYDSTCFAGGVYSQYLDENGQLWALYWDDGITRLGLCKPGQTMEDAQSLDIIDEEGRHLFSLDDYLPRTFALWGDYVIVCSSVNETGSTVLVILNLAEKTAQTLELGDRMVDFCLDGGGNLYALAHIQQMTYNLVKYSLEDGKILWRNQDLPYDIKSLWYLDGGLFLMGGSPDKKIFTIDTETGEQGSDILNFWADVGLQSQLDENDSHRYNSFTFGLDRDGWAAVSCMTGTNSAIRLTWTLEPYVLDLAPEDIVTLTITAPYPVDSIAGAVRMYQQEHPEVQIVWDTQYISREEFQRNVLEYKDQIALRTMTGDVGDIQMISGSGLSLDVITDTDAFADLTPYLEVCPFLDELELNLLDPLRDTDGAVRALPLGINPQYAIYNMTLLEELGSPIDPDTVTWSELLDLALQWKEEGTDLSLMSCSMGEENSIKEYILTWLLLANLYDAKQADGTVQLDQPYLRELLTKLKDLWDSRQLVRTDGNRVVTGFFKKALFTTFYSTLPVMDRLGSGCVIPESEGIRIQAAPMPWGEVYHKQQGYAFCWGIPASSEQKDAAWDLLQFLISSNGFPNYSYSEDTELLNNSAQTSWYEQFVRIEGNSRGKEFFEQTQALRKLPVSRFDEPYGWYEAVFTPILKFMSDELTLDEAMETANANWERFVLE